MFIFHISRETNMAKRYAPEVNCKKLKGHKANEQSISEICIEGKYRAFHRFEQAKIANGCLVLGSSQFSILPHCLKK